MALLSSGFSRVLQNSLFFSLHIRPILNETKSCSREKAVGNIFGQFFLQQMVMAMIMQIFRSARCCWLWCQIKSFVRLNATIIKDHALNSKKPMNLEQVFDEPDGCIIRDEDFQSSRISFGINGILGIPSGFVRILQSSPFIYKAHYYVSLAHYVLTTQIPTSKQKKMKWVRILDVFSINGDMTKRTTYT